MQLSLTHSLLAIELAFPLALALRADWLAPARGTMVPVYVYLAWLIVYAIATSIFGARGVYVSDDML
ncbi:MAG: hypothetical protein OEM91_03295, partial [Hyphomicrobiales bacterium]|nr:hypothetical protein [Hyphomicrobiales bacterium]